MTQIYSTRAEIEGVAAFDPAYDDCEIVECEGGFKFAKIIPPKQKFSFGQFSITNQLDAMKKQMLNDVFVLDGVALLGQLTAIYAKPNTGKTLLTLWMLTESIKAGRIKGENVFYINADDTYKGLLTKGEVAQRYGFSMIAPSFMDFKVEDFNNYLRQLIADDSARGVIIVLDTLKKFTDLMDKKKGSEFMKLAREFASNGGTMVMLAHTNKNRSFDGKVVAAGTSDIVDDCDCAFLLDELPTSTDTQKQVMFENIKNRGNVARELTLTYSNAEKQFYSDLLDSVQIANNIDTREAKTRREAQNRLEKDDLIIEGIKTALQNGIGTRQEIVAYCQENNYGGRIKTDATLKRYTGTKLTPTTFWRVMDMPKNGKCYYLLNDSSDYEKAKNGE